VNGYFDWNATAPLHPAAREAWLEASDRFWYNPSGLYREGAEARERLEDCRERAAALLGCDPEQMVFTSGATEADNAVIRWVSGQGEAPVVISALEHPAVSEPAAAWLGGRLVMWPCGRDGVADLGWLADWLGRHRPALVSLMAANNETGVLQPWREAAELCTRHGVPFHCDAAQWCGRLPSEGLGACDFVTVSGHKLGGPKGVGLLKLPRVVSGFRILRGGQQEERRRAGTENLPGIVAMLAAWEAEAASAAGSDPAQLAAPRDAFEGRIAKAVPGMEIVSRQVPRLWNTSLLLLPRGPNVKWVARLSRSGLQTSTGSACSRGGGASEVLAAMGIPGERAGGALRLSSGRCTQLRDWDELAARLVALADEIT
jgi:cysteine desulfurase